MATREELINSLAFRSALLTIKPDSSQRDVQMLWNVLIFTWFPGNEGYKFALRSCGIVVQVQPRESGDFVEHPVFMVECKKPTLDTPDEWELTREPPFDALGTTNGPRRLFGAVVLGKKVGFYRFDGRAPSEERIVPLRLDVIDLGTDNGIDRLKEMMDLAKGEGWQWATSGSRP